MECKNCKYFSSEGDFSGTSTNDNFKIGYDYSFEKIEFNKAEPNQVIVEGDEGWGFIVGKNFGCIHFEEEEKKQTLDYSKVCHKKN